jgi:Family of unknown function (DUF5677)
MGTEANQDPRTIAESTRCETMSSDDPRAKNFELQLTILEEWLAGLEGSTTARTGEGWLFISLLKSTRRAYGHLRNGWQSDSTYTAWACRNLFELRVFAKYVARSPTDRKRFMDDLAVDSSESAKALTQLVKRVATDSDALDQETSSLSAAVGALQNKLQTEEKSYLSATTLAKGLGLTDELTIHKLCSKLVHPTVQAIMSIEFEDQKERDVLFLFGGTYVIDLMNDLVPLMQSLLLTATQAAPFTAEI